MSESVIADLKRLLYWPDDVCAIQEHCFQMYDGSACDRGKWFEKWGQWFAWRDYSEVREETCRS